MCSSASTEVLSVPSKVICPVIVSSSSRKPSCASSSCIRLLPKFSFATLSPASEPELSVTSKSKNVLLPSCISRYLSINNLPFE